MTNGIQLVLSSHNPLVLGSNPSGPSLLAKTDSQPTRRPKPMVSVVRTQF
jgi:hypothetical protein